MQNNWKTYKLGNVADIQNGYAFGSKDFSEIGMPIIKIKNIVPPYISLEEAQCYNKTIDLNLKKYQIRKNDVLISMTGSTVNQMSSAVGKIGRYKFDYPALLNQRVGKLYITNENIADYNYLYYYISRYEVQYNLALNATGSANQANISPNQIKDINLDLPPLPEQQAIAEILSSLDDKIELNLQANKTLEEMANALYKHWFVDFGPFKEGKLVESELGLIPDGWQIGVLSDIASFSNGYGFKSADLLDDNIGDCYHVFKMGHIKKGGGLKSDATKSYVQINKCKNLTNFILKKGDCLMSMTDMKDKVSILGHTALMNENNKYIVNQRVGLLRVKKEHSVGYPYLFILTNSVPFLNDLRSRANSGVQVNLSTQGIVNTKILIAPKQINENFNEIVIDLFEHSFELFLENELLKQARDYLLPKLISGEIRIKDAAKAVKEVI